MIIITTYIMLIFRLYRATPYSQTFEPWRKKFSKEKKKRKKVQRDTSSNFSKIQSER